MTVTELLDHPSHLERIEEDPVFLEPSGRRQKLLENALVAVLVAALIFLGLACCGGGPSPSSCSPRRC